MQALFAAIFHSCRSTIVLYLCYRMEIFSWFKYHLLGCLLIVGYFGIKPVEGRRIRGFSMTSLNGRERGYSLASQGGMVNDDDVEMMERTEK